MVGRTTRGELVRYDAKSADYVPFLSGISAVHVSLSKDGQWVAYVSVPGGNTLEKQIGRQPATPAQLPAALCPAARWSPDGKQIAFWGNSPGQKVNIVYSFERWRNAARTDTRRPPGPMGPLLVARRNTNCLQRRSLGTVHHYPDPRH